MSGVAITGMGIISSAGTNLEDFWNTLESGTITYKEIKEFQEDKNYRIKIGARIEDDLWQARIPNEYKRTYGRASQYCISAAASAIENADINLKELSKLRVAVVISTTMGEIQVEEQLSVIQQREGMDKIPQELLTQYRTDHIVSALTNVFHISGPVYMVPAACAGANFAIGLGRRLIEWDEADLVITGGVDVFSRVAFTGFQRLLALAPDLCRPFDKNRKGLVLGEGCGIVILERTRSAKARKAKIWGELAGVGLTSDRFHMTAPHPQGDGAARAINQAMQEADISANDIDYISAHGTGTAANDMVEVKALETVFGSRKIPPLSSIKSMVGHPMGAAGAIGLIASLQMMENNTMLPTVNYSTLDPDCDIDCVPNISRKANLDCILSNSFGFGGQSSSILVKKG